MQRPQRSPRKLLRVRPTVPEDFTSRFLLRCASCWAVPLLFAILQIATYREDAQQSPWNDSALLALGGVVVVAGSGGRPLRILQLLLVYLFFSGPIPQPAVTLQEGSQIAEGPLQGHAAAAGPQPVLVAPASQLRGSSAAIPALQPGRISVVLPCLNESEFAVKTVQSFCNRTPSDLLAEIIVVDDGSWPPLEIELRRRVDAACRLRAPLQCSMLRQIAV
eukprot:s8630_g1.t1